MKSKKLIIPNTTLKIPDITRSIKTVESILQSFSQSFRIPTLRIPPINTIPKVTQDVQIAIQQAQKSFYILHNLYRIPELLSGIALINVFRSFERHIESVYKQEKEKFIINFFKEDRYKGSFAKSVVKLAIRAIQRNSDLQYLDIHPYENRVQELYFDEIVNELFFKVKNYTNNHENMDYIINFNQLFSFWGNKPIDELSEYAKERDIEFLLGIRKYFVITVINIIRGNHRDNHEKHKREIYGNKADNFLNNMGFRRHDIEIVLDSAALNPIEYEILDLRLKGYTTREIAQKLNISHPTVVRYLKKITKKLKNVMNQIELFNRSIY